MRDQSLFYWGMVVTIFLLIAAMITARDLFEMYLEKREGAREGASAGTSSPAK